MKKHDPNSKSFFGSNIFNMSFLMSKPSNPPTTTRPVTPPITNPDHNKSTPSLPKVNSSTNVNKYPTNENSLVRMASYAVLPTTTTTVTSQATIGNAYLHPAAAGMNTKKLIRHSSVLQQERLKQLQSTASHDIQSQSSNVTDIVNPNINQDKPIITTEKRDFSRFYKQSSLSNSTSFADEMDFFRIANFALDCGPSYDKKILSYQHAIHVAAFLHPGTVNSDGFLEQHPLSSDFGWFDFPFQKIFRGGKSKKVNVLEKYGIGITLWFKFLVSISFIIYYF